jgi:sporulation integral membrane protein YtvI
MNFFNPRLVHQVFRGSWVTIVIIAVCLFFYWAMPIFTPFLLAWILAYILKPITRFLHSKLRLPNWLASIITLILFIGISTLLIIFIIANIIIEINLLSQFIQKNRQLWMEQFNQLLHSAYLQNMVNGFQNFYKENPGLQDTINQNLSMTATNIAEVSQSIINNIFSKLIKLVATVPNILVFTIVFLLSTFFISKDWIKIKDRLSKLLPESLMNISTEIHKDLQKALFGYVKALLILVSLTSIFVMIGLMILGVKYAVTIGLLIGLVDLLPYLGTGIVFIPWILISFFFNQDIYMGIGLSILYGTIFVIRQLIEPKVIASSVNMYPLFILFSIFAGLQIFGVIGIFIGPVTSVTLYSLHRSKVFLKLKNYVQNGTSDSSNPTL